MVSPISLTMNGVVQELQDAIEPYATVAAHGMPFDNMQEALQRDPAVRQTPAAFSQELQRATPATNQALFHQHCRNLISQLNRLQAVTRQRAFAPQFLFQTAIGRLTTEIQNLSQETDRLAQSQPLSAAQKNQLRETHERIALQLTLLQPYAQHHIREEYTRMLGSLEQITSRIGPLISDPSLLDILSSARAVMDAVPFPVKALILSYGLYQGYRKLSLLGAAVMGMSKVYHHLTMSSSVNLPPPVFGRGLSSDIALLHADVKRYSSSPSEAETLRLRDRLNALLNRVRGGENISDTDRNTLCVSCLNQIKAWREAQAAGTAAVNPAPTSVRSQTSSLGADIALLHADIRRYGSSSPSEAETLRLRDRLNALLTRDRNRAANREMATEADRNTLCVTCVNQIRAWRQAQTARAVPVNPAPIPVRTITGTLAAPLTGGDQRRKASSVLQAANLLGAFFQDSQMTAARIGSAVKQGNNSYAVLGDTNPLRALVQRVGFLTLQQMRDHDNNDPVALQAPAAMPATLASCQQLLLEISTGVGANKGAGAILTKGERTLSIGYQNGPGQPKFVVFDPSTLSAYEFTDRDVAASFLHGLVAQMPAFSGGQMIVCKATKALPIDGIYGVPIPEERQVTVNGNILDMKSFIPHLVKNLTGKDLHGVVITEEGYRTIFTKMTQYLGVTIQKIFNAFIENRDLPLIATRDPLAYLSIVAAGQASTNNVTRANYRNAVYREGSVNSDGRSLRYRDGRLKPGRAERFIQLLQESGLSAAERQELIQDLTPSINSRPAPEAVVIPADHAPPAAPLPVMMPVFGQGVLEGLGMNPIVNNREEVDLVRLFFGR